MKIVYGPIASWRLGRSLGVDLLCSEKKICSFDCIYCQLEKSDKITSQRDTFVSTKNVEKELKNALKQTTPDVITFSGTGEPTLAKNMHEVVNLIKGFTDIPLAILTNSTLLYDKNVYETLGNLDIIVAKLDAPNKELFQKINRPANGITFEKTLKGIKELRQGFHGKFALQIMFMKENKDYANDLAQLAKKIHPDEVQINTPLRQCNIQPLSKEELDEIEKAFAGLNTLCVYKSQKPVTVPLDMMELIKRRRMEP
ncbi:MAG: radical SAM protein [Thermoplasmatales archaeon]|nr:MAG: radical SAM protein [Thermoplasmatales archaeon]